MTLPAILTVSEQDRRFGAMMKLYGMQGTEMPAPEGELVLNANSAMIKRLSEKVSSDEVGAEEAAKYIFSLATPVSYTHLAFNLRQYRRVHG